MRRAVRQRNIAMHNLESAIERAEVLAHEIVEHAKAKAAPVKRKRAAPVKRKKAATKTKAKKG